LGIYKCLRKTAKNLPLSARISKFATEIGKKLAERWKYVVSD
jgi:hypothetical protein